MKQEKSNPAVLKELRVRLHEGKNRSRTEPGEDITLDVDENNRVISITVMSITVMSITVMEIGITGEFQAREEPGKWLKLIDPEHEDELQSRLDDVNTHFRRMAGAVMNDQDALLLLEDLNERKTVDFPEFREAGIPLARLTAAGFCEVGAGRVYITGSGMRFVQSIQNQAGEIPAADPQQTQGTASGREGAGGIR